MLEYFRGNRQERSVLEKRDQLGVKPNLSRGEQYRLQDLEEDAREISRRLFWRRVGGAAAGFSLAGGVAWFLSKKDEQRQELDLELDIDEAGFWRVVNGGHRFGIITQTEDRNKMDHLRPHGNLWVAETSSSFRVAINKPMADFMFKQADLINPSLPTRMLFVEAWLDPARGEHTGGFTAISDNGVDQIIIISLKAVALEAFLDLERKGLSLVDYFDGALSYFASRYTAHEIAHAGRQTKRLFKRRMTFIPDDLLDAIHPQISAFDQKYTQLYNQASDRSLGEAAMIFAVGLEERVNLSTFRAQILQEARLRGMVK